MHGFTGYADHHSVNKWYQIRLKSARYYIIHFMTNQLLTLIEIAERTGSSKITVRRYLDAKRFPHAIREVGRGDGRWLVPWDDVVSSGLARRIMNSEPAVGESTPEGDPKLVESLMRTIESQAQTIEQLTRTLDSLVQKQRSSHGA